MNKNDKIYIAGHSGLVGISLINRLKTDGYKNIILRTSKELDLTQQVDVEKFFISEKPDYVFLLAAKVGGIVANEKNPVEFIYPNIMIESNVISSAWKSEVKKLFFLGCACVYPKESPQPIKEEYLLTGKPEPTNLAHTVAKLAGIVLCQSFNKQYGTNFISGISSNVFGPYDNFDSEAGHVVPALINKFHSAKMNNEKNVTIWGTGKPSRDFIYVDDVVDACLFLMEKYESSKIINIGEGTDISIGELAELVKEVVGYKGKIMFDTSKPDGMMKKLLDNSKIKSLGWQEKISFKEGLEKTYKWWLENKSL